MSDFDITQIPTVMRAKKWLKGAKLMEKWFAACPNAHPASGIPSTDIITMNWVLTYNRAKIIYDELVKEKVWLNDAAKEEIIVLLKRKLLLKNKKSRFGYPKMPVSVADRDYIQFRKVGGDFDMAFGVMDDLRAALANFVFRMIMSGIVEPLLNEKKLPTGEYKVTIKEVGIYVRDSYDFNDIPGEDQSLGNWDIDDNSVGRTIFNGGVSVHNSDFRKWREDNGVGGDFLVYSDVKYLKQDTDNTFTFKK